MLRSRLYVFPRAGLALLAAGAALAGPAAAATGAGAGAASLAGVETVVATRSSYQPVLLSAPATVDIESSWTSADGSDPNKDLVVKGRGRVIGFVLTQMSSSSPPTSNAPTLIGLQVGLCDSPGCAPQAPPLFGVLAYGDRVRLDANGSHATLPAGRYGLYALTDGAPVDVQLRLHGLQGSSLLTPTTSISAAIYPTQADATGVRYDGQAAVHLPTPGLIGYVAATRGAAAWPQGGACVLDGAEPDQYESVNAATVCAPYQALRDVDQLTGAQARGFRGHNGEQGRALGNSPGGTIAVWAPFKPGAYREEMDWTINPSETERSFLGFSIPWQSLN